MVTTLNKSLPTKWNVVTTNRRMESSAERGANAPGAASSGTHAVTFAILGMGSGVGTGGGGGSWCANLDLHGSRKIPDWGAALVSG